MGSLVRMSGGWGRERKGGLCMTWRGWVGALGRGDDVVGTEMLGTADTIGKLLPSLPGTHTALFH